MKVEIEKATVVTCPSTLVTVNHGDANCLSSAPDMASWARLLARFGVTYSSN